MKAIRNTVIFLLGFTAILFLCDLFINFAGVYSVNNTEYTEGIGKTIRPNLHYTYFNEGFAIGRTNSYGYFGKEYPKEKSDSVVRIALLGDSYIEGIQVFTRDHFAALLEKEYLKQEKNVEVLNFGRSEFGLGNMYAYQKLFVDQFSPDLVLYFLTDGSLENDYRDPLLSKTLVVNDSLVLNTSASDVQLKKYKIANGFLKRSALLSMVNNSKRYLTKENLKKQLRLAPTKQDRILSTVKNETLSELSKKIINAFDKEKIILVWWSKRKISDVLIKQIEKKNIQLINLSYCLNTMEQSNIDPYHWNITDKQGHWNHEAHKVIANQISKVLFTQ